MKNTAQGVCSKTNLPYLETHPSAVFSDSMSTRYNYYIFKDRLSCMGILPTRVGELPVGIGSYPVNKLVIVKYYAGQLLLLEMHGSSSSLWEEC